MILTKHRLVRHLTHTLHMSNSNNKKATEVDKNENDRARNLCTISFLGSSESEVRLIRHLKHVKAKTGLEIKTQILKAALTLNDLYAVGDNPESTRAELEDAMLIFLIELTSHLSRGLSYCQNHTHKIESPNGWKQFCLIANSVFPTGSIELKNNEGSDDLDRLSTIVPKSSDLTEHEEQNKEDGEDNYAYLSDDDYLAMIDDRIVNPVVKD